MSDWIERLLDLANLPARSRRQYHIGLKYWDTWHRLHYATPLPLSGETRQAVTPVVVDDFLADHTPICRDGRVRMRMVDEIDQGLREAGYNRDIDCVSPKTTFWRIEVLKYAHRLADLPFDRKAAFRKEAELNAIWEAERAAVGAPTAVPMSVASIVSVLLSGCGDDRDGVRDAALIVLARRLTVGQICQLNQGDWRFGEKTVYGQVVPTMELDIREPVGEVQAFDRSLCLLGEEAERVKAWWDIRNADGAIEADSFLIRIVRKKGPRPLFDKWICSRFRALAQRMGIAGATGRSSCSPNAIRKAFEREWREHSGLVRMARMAGMSTQAMLRYGREL